MRLKSALSVLFLVSVLLSGCASSSANDPGQPGGGAESAAPEEPSSALPAGSRKYEVRLQDRNTLVMDASGNRLDKSDQTGLSYESLIYDLFTREPIFITRTKYEPTGQFNDYGQHVLRSVSTLSRPDGSPLLDWADGEYLSGFGDWVLCSNARRSDLMNMMQPPADYRSELINSRTGEVLLSGVDGLTKLDENTLIAQNYYFGRSELLAIIDRSGQITKRFTPPVATAGYINCAGGNIFTYMEESGGMVSSLFTPDLKPLFTASDISPNYAGDERYLYYRNTSPDSQEVECGYIEAATGEKVLSMRGTELSLDYFDGERLIARESFKTFFLCDETGNRLTENYDTLLPGLSQEQLGSGKRAPYYFGLRDGKCERLRRDGSTEKTIDLPLASEISFQGGDYLNIFYPDSRSGDYSEQLVDLELNTIVQPGLYRWIRQLSILDNTQTEYCDLFYAYQQIGDLTGRYVLLDKNGSIILDQISEVGTVGPNRIAIKRGFYAGLIDWEGNWVAKHSIFDEINDDQASLGF